MRSFSIHHLPCKCLAKIEMIGEYWECSECQEEVRPHQLREWPTLENGEKMERPKDKGQALCRP